MIAGMSCRRTTIIPHIMSLRLPRPRKVVEDLRPKALNTIQKPILKASNVNLDISIKDFEYIGSYNWINSRSPAILVPGELCLPSKQDKIQ